jgi:hypothetical protein
MLLSPWKESPQELKPNIYRVFCGTDERVAEKRFFCALRFAARTPAAARKYYFPTTYGTAEAVPFRKISMKLSFSATCESVP